MPTEEEMMAHLPDVVKFCKLSNTKYRVSNFRSLKVVEVFHQGQWMMFDPVNRNKDTVRLLMRMSHHNKVEVFRRWILQEAINELERSLSVPEKR